MTPWCAPPSCERAKNLVTKCCRIKVCASVSGDHDHVVAFGKLRSLAAKDLTHHTAHAVAPHGVGDFSARDQSKASTGSVATVKEHQGEMSSIHATPFLLGGEKVHTS
jgi:hypothetical protein